MSDELLPFYNRELSFIRHMAAEFAAANPKIAGRLRLGPESSEDPHVERLIEAFAYLNARTRHKIEDDFPELTDAILGVLYPHYLAPIPSMSIVQFHLDPGQAELATGYTVPRGAAIETEPIRGEPCRFRTCYPATIWPIDVQSVTLTRPPFTAPVAPASADTAAMLRVVLRSWSPMQFANFQMESLRFFIGGQPQLAYTLYELIFNNTTEVVLASSANDPQPIRLGANALKQVGFSRDEGLVPYSPHSFLAYRLLSEFFTFPTKFLFLELDGLNPRNLSSIGPQLELFFFLNETSEDLEQNISTDMFRLGCTPMVNLFSQRAEPIPLTGHTWEYRIVPDARRPLAMEVYSVDQVSASSPSGKQVDYVPFFSIKHASRRDHDQPFWHAVRRPAGQAEGTVDAGTEVYLSLVDLDFSVSSPADWTVDVVTTCCNRDLPQRLPFGGGQPRLQLTEGNALVTRISCLTPPTPTLRPPRRNQAMWRLISHLTLNHLSIIEQGQDGASALREMLKLYDFTESPVTQTLIEGLLDVRSRRIISRIGGTDGRRGEVAGGFCRGIEVTLLFDEERFAGSGLFLFACVLERFLALYSSINSFTQMVATIKGREGILRRWPPRAGEQVLL